MLAKLLTVGAVGGSSRERDLAEGSNLTSHSALRYLEFLISIYFADFKNGKGTYFKN